MSKTENKILNEISLFIKNLSKKYPKHEIELNITIKEFNNLN